MLDAGRSLTQLGSTQTMFGVDCSGMGQSAAAYLTDVCQATPSASEERSNRVRDSVLPESLPSLVDDDDVCSIASGDGCCVASDQM